MKTLLAFFMLSVTAMAQTVTVDDLPLATNLNESAFLVVQQPITGRSTNDTQRISTPSLLSGYAEIFMPTYPTNTLYALEGRELNVYYRNIIASSTPVENLKIKVTCTKGNAMKDRWTYTPEAADAGLVFLTVSVYTEDGAYLLASKLWWVITRALSHPPTPVTRQVLLIGDSTTANGIVSSELTNLFVGDAQYTYVAVGSNVGTVSDSEGTSRTVRMEAISGWGYHWFNHDLITTWDQLNGTDRVGSPFVNPATEVFDFNYYQTNWIPSTPLTNGDWVIFNCGINDMFIPQTDEAAYVNLALVTNAINSMVTSIQATVPGIRIGLCLTTPPAFSQDSFGDDYGSSYTVWRYLRNYRILQRYLIERYDDTIVSGVYLISLHTNIDSVNNFPTVTEQVNSRNTNLVTRASNGVHPAASGYYQVADFYRMFLKGKE